MALLAVFGQVNDVAARLRAAHVLQVAIAVVGKGFFVLQRAAGLTAMLGLGDAVAGIVLVVGVAPERFLEGVEPAAGVVVVVAVYGRGVWLVSR